MHFTTSVLYMYQKCKTGIKEPRGLLLLLQGQPPVSGANKAWKAMHAPEEEKRIRAAKAQPFAFTQIMMLYMETKEVRQLF